MIGEDILYQREDVEGRIRNKVKPFLCPIYKNGGHHLKSYKLIVLKELGKGKG